ncbi:MAG: hypothetical protein E7354_01300 [Clostridiales bacterium]|nr:hypothetical protein [Clostridiales bacterium]
MIILYILLAIVVLLLMIMIHETGHYLVGKLLKFKIEEYSIGFGKPIFQKTLKSGEVFSLRWIPLGGFCAFKGEDEDEEEENNVSEEEKKQYFNSYAPWKRLLVLVSGALFNFVSGIIFTFVLLLSVGSGICQVTDIVAQNGNETKLMKGDIILEVEGDEPTFINGGIVKLMSEKDVGEDIVLKIDRNGIIMDVVVQKYQEYQKDENGEIVKDSDGNPIVAGKIVGITTEYVKYGFGDALLKCVPYTFQMAWECLVVLGELVTGEIGIDSVGGPITTVSTIATSTQANMKNLLLLFPLIAVNLAVFNLLPIPALDGARAVFVLIEWIFRKPVPRDLEGKIHTVGLFALFALVILIDLLHIFLF